MNPHQTSGFLRSLLTNFERNILKVFTPFNIFCILVGILITYICVITGFDWKYFNATREPELQDYMVPVGFIGLLVPVFGPFIILLIGKLRNNYHLKNTAYALGQAGIMGWLLSVAIKTFTGRMGPPVHTLSNAFLDISHQFRFGFYEGGIFWGWPSSHTTVAFAMSITLIYLYPKNVFIKALAILYALYIGIGISTNFHWFSDVVMGAILGTIVGIAVGKSFYKIDRT
ncbi:MAG: phosphoesterase PA-phosphatase related protein [Candidatus Nomurabacteria bacterium]|nr:phosphoesterase PA-phosphatase related protein [Candidatus Nomurabacteria bacterium]